jgi:membrane associated rhomboid family serine protease
MVRSLVGLLVTIVLRCAIPPARPRVQFAHAGPWHLAANLTLQLVFGLALNLPSQHLMLVYQGGVCCGALTAASWLCDPKLLALGLVGSSGGVYAILGLHLADLVLCPHKRSSGGRGRAGEVRYRGSRLVALAAVAVVDVAATALQGVGTASFELDQWSNGGQASWATHVGGGLVGLLAGLSGLLPRPADRDDGALGDAAADGDQPQGGSLKWPGLQGPRCGARRRFVVAWAARAGAVALVGGEVAWYAAHDPPAPGGGCAARARLPCCWQLRSCQGLAPSDFALFRCAAEASIEDGGDWEQKLWYGGDVLKTCANLTAAAARTTDGS